MSALSTRYRSLLVKHGNLHDLQEDYSGLFQGYFFGIFQLTQVFGNLVSGYIEHAANVKTLFLVYFGMIMFGILLLLYVPKLKEFKDSSSSDVVKNVISNIEQLRILPRMVMKMTLKRATPLIWTLLLRKISKTGRPMDHRKRIKE